MDFEGQQGSVTDQGCGLNPLDIPEIVDIVAGYLQNREDIVSFTRVSQLWRNASRKQIKNMSRFVFKSGAASRVAEITGLDVIPFRGLKTPWDADGIRGLLRKHGRDITSLCLQQDNETYSNPPRGQRIPLARRFESFLIKVLYDWCPNLTELHILEPSLQFSLNDKAVLPNMSKFIGSICFNEDGKRSLLEKCKALTSVKLECGWCSESRTYPGLMSRPLSLPCPSQLEFLRLPNKERLSSLEYEMSIGSRHLNWLKTSSGFNGLKSIKFELNGTHSDAVTLSNFLSSMDLQLESVEVALFFESDSDVPWIFEVAPSDGINTSLKDLKIVLGGCERRILNGIDFTTSFSSLSFLHILHKKSFNNGFFTHLFGNDAGLLAQPHTFLTHLEVGRDLDFDLLRNIGLYFPNLQFLHIHLSGDGDDPTCQKCIVQRVLEACENIPLQELAIALSNHGCVREFAGFIPCLKRMKIRLESFAVENTSVLPSNGWSSMMNSLMQLTIGGFPMKPGYQRGGAVVESELKSRTISIPFVDIY